MTSRFAHLTRWLVPSLLAAAAAIGLVVGQHYAIRRAVDAEAARARAAAVLLASGFRRELEKFRLVSVVLAQDRQAIDALETGDRTKLRALDVKLEALGGQTRAAVVYLLDAQGIARAASNWRDGDSFVGTDYAFRGYFRDAMRTGRSQQFALGTRSGRAGLYLANRLVDRGRAIGVVVVKVEVDGLEREWRQSGFPAFATDRRGIILVTSVPGWRFATRTPLSAAMRAAIRRDRDYGDVALSLAPPFAAGSVAAIDTRQAYARPYVEAVEPTIDGWRIHVLGATTAPIAAAVTTIRLVLLTAVLTLTGAYLVWRYRRRVAAGRAEAAVTARIETLNQRLAQANKLAILGQVTAGVGHEINQPVAAIGVEAFTARELIARGATHEAVTALDRISALTARIGVITGELRGFARRGPSVVAPTAIDDAIDGALLLLRERIRSLGVAIERVEDRAVRVVADHVRLEQVLVNLLANALDAGATTIRIVVRGEDGLVRLSVADDGPGLSAAARASLFQPFATSKSDGLGLGLVISQDILADLSGTLVATDPPRGAEFVVTLGRAG